ncbi:MAG: DUF488 domain-containing protein [Candidatus Eiseniibacteriota bacterium]|jgi:uncharacterized protein (DUF488 family)
MDAARPAIVTVGHSSRSLEQFLALLTAHTIRTLVDVRAYPRSKRYPHFDGPALAAALASHGIDYHHLPALGGKRPAVGSASPDTGWRDAAMRAYAAHTRTALFASGLDAVLRLATVRAPLALMCAERDWQRCHRQMIADALLVRGVAVRHILDAGEIEAARLTPGAERHGDGLIYLAPQRELFPAERTGGERPDETVEDPVDW